MAQHCGKHDIIFAEGGTCWNCEDSAMTREEKDKAYSDPKHLAKRTQNTPHYHVAQAQPENFTDEQVLALADRFEALLKARQAAGSPVAPPAEA